MGICEDEGTVAIIQSCKSPERCRVLFGFLQRKCMLLGGGTAIRSAIALNFLAQQLTMSLVSRSLFRGAGVTYRITESRKWGSRVYLCAWKGSHHIHLVDVPSP